MFRDGVLLIATKEYVDARLSQAGRSKPAFQAIWSFFTRNLRDYENRPAEFMADLVFCGGA